MKNIIKKVSLNLNEKDYERILNFIGSLNIEDIEKLVEEKNIKGNTKQIKSSLLALYYELDKQLNKTDDLNKYLNEEI